MTLRPLLRLLVILSQVLLALHFLGILGRPIPRTAGDILAGCAALFIAALFSALAVWDRKDRRITPAR